MLFKRLTDNQTINDRLFYLVTRLSIGDNREIKKKIFIAKSDGKSWNIENFDGSTLTIAHGKNDFYCRIPDELKTYDDAAMIKIYKD